VNRPKRRDLVHQSFEVGVRRDHDGARIFGDKGVDPFRLAQIRDCVTLQVKIEDALE